jgi:predicted RNA-binding protein YlxR (DUF448 family)
VAVRTTTAADHFDGPARPRTDGPVRTCIGCRKRAAAAELLRVVVAPAPAEPANRAATEAPGLLAVPDPRCRAPGRGAWLHRDPGCVALAERRRAFSRALRVPGYVDPAPVAEYVAELSRHHRPSESEN